MGWDTGRLVYKRLHALGAAPWAPEAISPRLVRRARQPAATGSPDQCAFRFACADLLVKSFGSAPAGAKAANPAKNRAYLCNGAAPAAILK